MTHHVEAIFVDYDADMVSYVDYCNVIDIDKTNKEALLFRAYIYMQRRDCLLYTSITDPRELI